MTDEQVTKLFIELGAISANVSAMKKTLETLTDERLAQRQEIDDLQRRMKALEATPHHFGGNGGSP